MRVILTFLFVVIIGCKKMDFLTIKPEPPVNQEDVIKYSTNLDSGINYVDDTLNLKISVTSKIPQSGLIYSIGITWLENNEHIFQFDTISNSSLIDLKIKGMTKVGSYNVKIDVKSKSIPNNSNTKYIYFINDPVQKFNGYKVDKIALSISKQKDNGISYWTNTPVMGDLIVSEFQNPKKGTAGFLNPVTYGDMNNDGYIDVFNAGTHYITTQTKFGFLIWNQEKKIFENKNLFNDKSFESFGRNKNKTIPIYLNNDDYVDFVSVDIGDEGTPPGDDAEPIWIILSDGKGGYDLKNIETNENDFIIENNVKIINNGAKEDISIGDLNEDDIPDLAMISGNGFYIYWGIKSFPYFSKDNPSRFFTEKNGFGKLSNNGFGEIAQYCAGAMRVDIFDLNKDGKNDIFLHGEDKNAMPFSKQFRVLINLGKGRFNNNGVKWLPYVHPIVNYLGQDAILDDINKDGLNDIIVHTYDQNYVNWGFTAYIQKSDGTFSIDYNMFQFTINKDRLQDILWKNEIVYYDFDGDGQKDISYRNSADHRNSLLKKSVFIRRGSQFIEEDIYKYDIYAKSLVSRIK